MTAPFAVSAQRPTPRQQQAVSSPRPLRRLLPRIQPYLWRLILAFVCLLGSASIALAFPQIVRHLLDAAFISADASLLNRIALGLVILFAIQAVLNFVQVYLLTSTSELVIAQLREDLFAHLVRLSPAFFTERRTGELTSHLSADTAVLQTVLSYNLSEFARQTLVLVGGIVLLSLTDANLTATTQAVVPLVVGAAVVF
jgi:subfamily B ATP-binding cassette protein MsbA